MLLDLKLFYIKKRNQTTTILGTAFTGTELFYIKNRNQTTTLQSRGALVEALFYIKNRNQSITLIHFFVRRYSGYKGFPFWLFLFWYLSVVLSGFLFFRPIRYLPYRALIIISMIRHSAETPRQTTNAIFSPII